MSITSVERLPNQPSDEQGADGTTIKRWRAYSDQKFATGVTDTAATVLSSTLLPAYGAVLSSWDANHPNASTFRCIERQSVPTSESPFIFEVSCTFSTRFLERADRDQQPLSRQAQVSRDETEVTIPWLTDMLTGELLTNTAGDPFSPPLTRTIRATVYTVKYNAASMQAWMVNHEQYVNAKRTVIRGRIWPPRSLVLKKVTNEDEIWQQGELFFPTTFTLVGDFRQWLKDDVQASLDAGDITADDITADDYHRQDIERLLNQGYFERQNGSPELRRRVMIDGRESDKALPLASDGSQIPADVLAEDPINSLHWLNPTKRVAADFNKLLPNMS